MEIIEVIRPQEQNIANCKEQAFGIKNMLDVIKTSQREHEKQSQNSQVSKINKRDENIDDDTSNEDRQNEEVKQAIKHKQDQYRVEIRSRKNKETIQSKRKEMMKIQLNVHINEVQKENQFQQYNEQQREQIFEQSLVELSNNFQSCEQYKLDGILEDLHILLRIDYQLAGQINHLTLCYQLIEILKNPNCSNNNFIKCMLILCSVQEYFSLDINQPSVIVNVLSHSQFIQLLTSKISTPLSSIQVQNYILYTLYIFTEQDNKFVDEIIQEQIIEKIVQVFYNNQQNSTILEKFDNTAWTYLLTLYSNLAQHSKFPKHQSYFLNNIKLTINMLGIQIEDQKSNELFKYSIMKSLSRLMRKDLGFISIFNENIECIKLIQNEFIQNCSNYLLLNELLDILSCLTSQEDQDELIYQLIFCFSPSQCENFDNRDENQKGQFFLLNTMFICLDEKVDIKMDKKIYLILLNILLSGYKCLQKCKEYNIAHKLIKIIQTEKNEQSYYTCLEVIRSYIELMDGDQDYKEILDLACSTNILQNYFNQTVCFQDKTKLQQLYLLQQFLFAGNKIIQMHHNLYTQNPVIQLVQQYHQLEFLNQFQYEQNPQIYQATSQIIQQYLNIS